MPCAAQREAVRCGQGIVTRAGICKVPHLSRVTLCLIAQGKMRAGLTKKGSSAVWRAY